MGVLREITRLPDAIHRLTAALRGLSDAQGAGAPPMERLEELERSRALWEAEMEAMVLRVESRYKATAAAEGRARKLSDKIDLFDQGGEEVETPVPGGDAAPSEEEEMHPVYMGLAPNSKAYALRAKYSL